MSLGPICSCGALLPCMCERNPDGEWRIAAWARNRQARAGIEAGMLTKEELAARLSGAEYRREVPDDLAAAAKAAGLVIIHGASDDLVILRGAIEDEIDMYEGGEFELDVLGVLPEPGEDRTEAEHAALHERRKTAKNVEAVWCDPSSEWAWSFQTDLPHSTFSIYEDGDEYCLGIVIALADLGSP